MSNLRKAVTRAVKLEPPELPQPPRADVVIKAEPTDEEKHATTVTVDGVLFKIRARLHNVDIRFGSVKAVSNNGLLGLDLLESPGKWAFNLRRANQGQDILVSEKDIDKVTLTPSTDFQIMSLTILPKAKFAEKLTEELANGNAEWEVLDLRSPIEGAGKIAVELSSCDMIHKKTFRREFDRHFKETPKLPAPPLRWQCIEPDDDDDEVDSGWFVCDHLGLGELLKKRCMLFLNENSIEISTMRQAGRNRLHVTFTAGHVRSYQLDEEDRVLALRLEEHFAQDLAEDLGRIFGGYPNDLMVVSSRAKKTWLRIRLKAGEDMDDLENLLGKLGVEYEEAPVDFLAKAFPELVKSRTAGATQPQKNGTAKRGPAAGASGQSSKKKPKVARAAANGSSGTNTNGGTHAHHNGTGEPRSHGRSHQTSEKKPKTPSAESGDRSSGGRTEPVPSADVRRETGDAVEVKQEP